jgi:hypothetical protein
MAFDLDIEEWEEDEKEVIEELICETCGKDISGLQDPQRHIEETCPKLPENIEKKRKRAEAKRKADAEASKKTVTSPIKTEEIEKKISENISAEIGSTLDDQDKKIDDMSIKLSSYEELLENLQEDLKELDFLKNEAEIKDKIIILIGKLNNKNKVLEGIYRNIETEAKSRKAFQLSEDRIITMIKNKIKIYDQKGSIIPFNPTIPSFFKKQFPRKKTDKRAYIKITAKRYTIDDKEIQNEHTLAMIREIYTNRRSLMKGMISIVNEFPELSVDEDTSTYSLDTKTLLSIRQYLSQEIDKSEKSNP